MTNTTTADRVVTESQSYLIRRLRALRAAMFVKFYDRAAAFAQDSAAGWTADGFKGMAAACWALSQELMSVAGAWDQYVEARALGELFAAEVA